MPVELPALIVSLMRQAHYINNRTMEIFRGISRAANESLAQHISATMPSLDEWRKFLYCETATGHTYGEVDHFEVGSGRPWEQVPTAYNFDLWSYFHRAAQYLGQAARSVHAA